MRSDPELREFFAKLSLGLSVAAFLQALEAIYGYTRASGMIHDFRLGRGQVKKLRDEVTPLARFVRRNASPDDIVSMPISDPPDFVIAVSSNRHNGIECTIAGARERLFTMRELNKTGRASISRLI